MFHHAHSGRRAGPHESALRRRAHILLEIADEQERRVLSERLHDDLCQVLAAANFKLAALRGHGLTDKLVTELESIEHLLGYACETTRSIAMQLSPPVLHTAGLSPALVRLAAETELHCGLKVGTFDDGAEKPLDGHVRTTLYLGVRELLQNIARHTNSDNAEVRSLRCGDRVRIEVSDGDGAAGSAQPALWQHGGLDWLRKRLALIGGELRIAADARRGLRVVMQVPLGDPDAPDVR